MATNITYRTGLLGGLADFCSKSNLKMLANSSLIVELVVALARCQEEGTRLSPKAYLINDMVKLLQMLPGCLSVKIGSATFEVEGIKEGVKKCAPLAVGGWAIYFHEQDTILEFGVFRGASNITSVPIDDIVLVPDSGLQIVKIQQLALDCVEVRAENGAHHYVYLDHRDDNAQHPLTGIHLLIGSILRQLKSGTREQLDSYFSRILMEALLHSHGWIVAVTSMNRPPRFLAKDGVTLDIPVDFSDIMERLLDHRSSEYELESAGGLLKGMLNSDGIVLFDNRARLLGFNYFVSSPSPQKVIGGARKRAYMALESKLGKGLSAVLMQSQDGTSYFKGSENE